LNVTKWTKPITSPSFSRSPLVFDYHVRGHEPATTMQSWSAVFRQQQTNRGVPKGTMFSMPRVTGLQAPELCFRTFRRKGADNPAERCSRQGTTTVELFDDNAVWWQPLGTKSLSQCGGGQTRHLIKQAAGRRLAFMVPACWRWSSERRFCGVTYSFRDLVEYPSRIPFIGGDGSLLRQ
jgi:hypothetical protein